jgi:hypothetical protein
LAVKPQFDSWMAAVDRHLMQRVGMTHDDMGDQCYSDWHNDGITPLQAARLVLENEGF